MTLEGAFRENLFLLNKANYTGLDDKDLERMTHLYVEYLEPFGNTIDEHTVEGFIESGITDKDMRICDYEAAQAFLNQHASLARDEKLNQNTLQYLSAYFYLFFNMVHYVQDISKNKNSKKLIKFPPNFTQK